MLWVVYSGAFQSGKMVQYDRPDWTSLLELVGEELTGWFMWMEELELEDGTRVDAYKHTDTRRYFHLAEDGRAFIYAGDHDYREVTLAEAIREAFCGWETLSAGADDLALVRAAIRRAGP
jgi:hypothetical protein